MGEPQRAARQQVPAERSSSPARSPAALARRSASRATGADPLQRLLSARALQPQLTVGPADDPFEREAERTASAVMAGPERREVGFGGESITASLLRPVQRAVGKGKGESEEPEKRKDEQARVQKEPSGPGPALVPAETEATITQMSRGGEPLAPSLRSFFEPRFGYDFGGTRLHSDGESGRAAMALGARAFTVGEHIFFGPGQFSPDSLSGRRLIAHELTHTIQQQPAAARAARLLRAPTRVQRAFDPLGGISATLKGWATRDFPPYELLTIIIGRDPITDEAVKFTAPAFLHAALRLVPDGETIYADLEQNKTIEATAKWFDGELTRLDLSGEKIKALFTAAYDEAVSWANVLSPARAWEKVKAVFVPPIQRVRAFALAVGARIFAVVKTAALDKIATWAARQQGYPLLTVVLGRDPVTDEEVKRTPANLVKAVLSLVPGGDKIFEHLEKSKAIERTVAWLNGEIARLDLSWDGIKALFQKAWNAFSVKDLLNPLGLVQKLLDIFGPPARRIIKFALAAGKKVLQFIFEGLMFLAGPLGQQIVRIFHKIGGAFDKIVEDPVGFVGHLVGAVKLGFTQFEKNIAEHLKNGLIGWLVGALDRAGLVLPKVWDLKGVLDLALQILGITYAKIRIKLVKVLGEKTVGMLETAFDFVRALVVEGPAAAWQQIVDAIGSLWDMVIGGIKSWAISKIVTAAITKLATMLNPAGAVIQAIVAIYQTVAFFVERIKQIGALVESIVDSIANIAAGKLGQAAGFIETAMARTIPVILGFLARLIGLGDVGEAIKKLIVGIQAKVDKGIDAAIAWIVKQAKALFGIAQDDKAPDALPSAYVEESLSMADESHTITARAERGHIAITMASGEDVLLRDLARQALEDLPHSPRPDEEKATDRLLLLQIQEWATERDLRASYDLAGRPQPFDVWLLKYVSRIITNNLLPLANKGIRSLQDFFQKIPGKRFLPPPYRRGEWIRENLYVPDSEWKSKRVAIRNRDVPRFAEMIDQANRTLDGRIWNELKIGPYDGKPGYRIPSSAELGKYTSADYRAERDLQVDHIIPIAKHWVSMKGNAMSDGPRKVIGSSDSNLELVTQKYNSRKGGEGLKTGDVNWVEEDFESKMAQSTKMYVRIKNLYFWRAESGGPLGGSNAR